MYGRDKRKLLQEALQKKLLPNVHLTEEFHQLYEKERSKEEKIFSFSPEEVNQLDRAVREIVSAAAKATNSVMPAFSVKSIAEPGKVSAAQDDEKLQAVAEGKIYTQDGINWSLLKSEIDGLGLWVVYDKVKAAYAEIHLCARNYKSKFQPEFGYTPLKNEIGLLVLEYSGWDTIKDKKPIFISHSELRDDFQHRGLGILLYLLGAELAHNKLKGYITPAETFNFSKFDFKTSKPAKETWERLLLTKMFRPINALIDVDDKVKKVTVYDWNSNIKLVPTIINTKPILEGEVEDISKWRERFKDKQGTGKTQFSPEEEEDALKLRQQYYGPEGEISKANKAKKVKPEKGIGELSPEEMEKAGYVIKVPKEVLADFDVMVDELKAVGNVYQQARDWYHNIKGILENVAGDDRGAALYGLLIATFSPRAKFSINLAEATFMFKAVQSDAATNPEKLKQYTQTFGGNEGEDEVPEKTGKTRHIGHMKVANFSLNLIKPTLAGEKNPVTGDLTYNEEYRWNSTIDTWMIDAFYPLLKKASTAGEYNVIKGKMMSDPFTYSYLSELVAKKAKQFNLLPHELQAIIWVAMKKRQSGEDAATTDDSFKQIEEAIRNVQSIHQDLNEINEELKKGSWAASIAKAIDERGIDAASDIVLGKQEIDPKTGKPIKIRGVRSIAMSGEKGDKYKYFPEPVAFDEPKAKADRRIKPIKGEPKAKEKAPYEDERFADLKTFYVLNNVIMMPSGKLNNLYNAINMYLQKDFSTDNAVQMIVNDFVRSSKTAAGFLEALLESKKQEAESLFARVKKILLSS